MASLTELLGQIDTGPVSLLQATVIAINGAAGTCTIMFAPNTTFTATPGSATNSYTRVETGSTTLDNITGVRYLASASFSVGDTVLVLRTGNSFVVIGKATTSRFGNPEFRDGLELYQSASTPYIDFHQGASPAGDSNADYSWRFILAGGNTFSLIKSGGYTFNWWNDGEFDCHHLGVNGDNVANLGVSVESGSVVIQGTAGRNWFRDTERSDGTGVRIGAAWGIYGMYSEVGDVVVGAASGKIQFQQGQYTMDSYCLQTWNRAVVFSAVNDDSTHKIYHDTVGADGLKYSSYTGHVWLTVVGACSITWDNSGQFYTNYGWGIDGNGALNSRYGGSGTGGALKTYPGGGNFIRFQWSPMSFIIDVTNVKTFVIDHPLDSDKYLVHACIEGPENVVFYRGQSRLENGWVQVDLPDYFEGLCAEEGRSVQLTCIADDPEDEWCPVLHATYPKNGRFWVGHGSGVHVMDQRFWWEVKAVRKDVDPLIVTPKKSEIEVFGDGPYTYYRKKAS